MNKVAPPRSFILVPARYPGCTGATHDSIECGGAVRVLGFGRNFKGAEQDWTFRNHKASTDATLDCSINRHLPEIARMIGERNFYAPTPVFGTQVVTSRMLSTRIVLRNDPIILYRGTAGDIMRLMPGETFAISLGGCAVAYLYHSTALLLVTGHVGRQNLEHVAEVMWKTAGVPESEKERVQVGICFPIDPRNFEHKLDDPTFGADNVGRCERLVERYGPESVLGWDDPQKRRLGRIDIGWVLRRQFTQLGVPAKNIHGTPSYDHHLGADDKPVWYTTRGSDEDKNRRNLVLVSHRIVADV